MNMQRALGYTDPILRKSTVRFGEVPKFGHEVTVPAATSQAHENISQLTFFLISYFLDGIVQ
jgi:hypothetical protein